MARTDLIVFVALILLGSLGAYQGFFYSLVWPLSLALSLTTSWLVFLSSHNLIMTLITSLIAPFVYKWFLNMLFGIIPGNEKKTQLVPLNRIAGAAVNLAWGGFLALVIVGLLALAPLNRIGLGDMVTDIDNSLTFKLIRPLVTVKTKPTASDVSCPACTMTPEKAQELAEDPAVQELAQDPRVQKMINDPALQEAVKSKNMMAVMNHPMIKELQNDPAFLIKAMRVYATLRTQEKNAEAQTPNAP